MVFWKWLKITYLVNEKNVKYDPNILKYALNNGEVDCIKFLSNTFENIQFVNDCKFCFRN